MDQDIKVLESAVMELDGIFSDSCKYPQLKMPDRQHERVKNLLFELRAYVKKHPMRAGR